MQQRRTNKRTGEVQELIKGEWVTVSKPTSPGIIAGTPRPTEPPKPNLPQGWQLGPDGVATPVQGLPGAFTQPASWRTLTPEEAKFYRLPDNRPYQISSTGEIKPIAGESEAPDPKAERERLWAARSKGKGILETIDQARGKVNDKSTGLLAKPLSFLGGTDATDLGSSIDTIKANLAFDRLQEMRDASTTGGALGSITENELKLLSSTVASLETSQSKEQLVENLAKVERHYKRFMLALEGVNPDSFKFDPFEVLKPEDARARAEALVREGADQATVEQFLRLQDMQYDPEEVARAVREGRGRVVDGQPSVGLGIQKGAEHVGSRAAEAVQAIPNALLGTDFSFGTDWKESMDRRFGDVYTDPSGEALGRFGASLPLAAIPNPFVAGALAGGLMGDSRDVQGVAGDALIGGVSGKIADKGIRMVAGALAPQIAAPVRNLHERGVRMTPGQMMGGNTQRAEAMRTSLPFAGGRIERQMDQSLDDLSPAIQDEVLKPIGQEANRAIPPGHAGVADAGARVSDEYNNILGQTSYTWSPGIGQKLLDRLGQRRMRPEVAKEVADTIQTEIGGTFSNGPTITGREWKTLDEQFGGLVEHYRKQGGPMRQAADAVRDIKRDMFADLVRQNGKRAGDIRKADRAHQRMRIYRNAATRDGASGTPTPSQLMNAAKIEAPYGRVAFSEGRAPMQDLAGDAQNVLPSSYSNSRTTDRSAAVAPTTKEGMIAHGQGLLLSPLYGEGAQRAMQNFLMAPRGPVAQGAGDLLRATPRGLRGMFGSVQGNRALFGNDGAYDQPLNEDEYRRLAW